MKVIISGAGIGGLTAALCLLERGFEVEVLEQASALEPVGAGIQLSANATRVLCQLGLQAALERWTGRPAAKVIRLWDTGQEWQLFDFAAESTERYGYPYMTLYRPDLHDVLVDALNARAPGALKLGARVTDVAQDGARATATLESGAVIAGDVLVGADGVHSVTRERLIAADRPRFSGCIAWRGVIPIERLPASMQENKGVNWVGPGGHVVHYPVHAGQLVSFTGIVETGVWTRESWTEEGSIEECRRDFAGWHADIQAFVRELDRPLRWAMMIRDPLANWTSGRVTLLGDAAHPTLPFLAQGAAMAVEDGRVLARALDAHRDAPERALRVYQATRIERTTRIVLGSAANTKRFHNPELGNPEGAAQYVRREWEPAKVRERYDWLFAYEPENVPLAVAPAAA